MGYRVMPKMDSKWQPRKGLEGPFQFANGKVLYYSPREGAYWDPTTDFFVSNEEMEMLHQMLVDFLAK